MGTGRRTQWPEEPRRGTLALCQCPECHWSLGRLSHPVLAGRTPGRSHQRPGHRVQHRACRAQGGLAVLRETWAPGDWARRPRTPASVGRKWDCTLTSDVLLCKSWGLGVPQVSCHLHLEPEAPAAVLVARPSLGTGLLLPSPCALSRHWTPRGLAGCCCDCSRPHPHWPVFRICRCTNPRMCGDVETS